MNNLGAPRIGIRLSGPGYPLYAPHPYFSLPHILLGAHVAPIRGATLQLYEYINALCHLGLIQTVCTLFSGYSHIALLLE
jgi:hypothetical protein